VDNTVPTCATVSLTTDVTGALPIANGGMDAALYCLVWLFFSAAGAGPWSLDARRGR
jgi:uncharacterized membrane protein YphA (DoxX/SURF4 family)